MATERFEAFAGAARPAGLVNVIVPDGRAAGARVAGVTWDGETTCRAGEGRRHGERRRHKGERRSHPPQRVLDRSSRNDRIAAVQGLAPIGLSRTRKSELNTYTVRDSLPIGIRKATILWRIETQLRPRCAEGLPLYRIGHTPAKCSRRHSGCMSGADSLESATTAFFRRRPAGASSGGWRGGPEFVLGRPYDRSAPSRPASANQFAAFAGERRGGSSEPV